MEECSFIIIILSVLLFFLFRLHVHLQGFVNEEDDYEGPELLASTAPAVGDNARAGR